MLKSIFGPKGEKLTGRWTKLYNGELPNCKSALYKLLLEQPNEYIGQNM
jgi:hypothetical protein